MRYQITKTDFQELLKHLLKENIVTEVLSGKEKKNRYAIVPEYVSDPAQIDEFPLSQLMVYGYTRTDSASNTILHSQKALNTKVAVIGRACDVRALVELEKKRQLIWENLFIIAFHDLGYLPNKPLRKFFKKTEINDTEIVYERLTSSDLILKMQDGTFQSFPLGKNIDIAGNCSRCIQKDHSLADFMIGTYTLSEKSEDYLITPQSKRADRLIEKLGWSKKAIDDKASEKYDQIAQSIIENCTIKREKDLSAFLTNEDRFSLLTKCTACGLCVKSCPVCYCKVCNLTAQVKAKKMDQMTFITTRFTHVGDTCVECGRCTTNCPMNIPLDLVFQSLRDSFKKQRDYEAGSKRKETVMHLDA